MINKERLLNTFIQIVQIDSPSGDEEAMAHYVTEFLNNLNISNQRDTYGNVLASVVGMPNWAPILLSAHLDTVEPGRGVVPQIEDGSVCSVGNTILGADNKAAVAAILEVLIIIAENNLTKIAPLEIVFTLSEEVANLGAVHLDYSNLCASTGYIFDSSTPIGTIITASPFYNRFDIKINGTAYHAGNPELGINALKIAMTALSHIRLGRLDEATVCNIGLFSGGTSRNTVPASVLLQGELRSFEEPLLVESTQYLVDTFSNVAEDLQGSVEIDVVRENGGFRLCPEHPLIQRGMKVLESLIIAPVLKEASGCYDANIFYEHGIEVLNFGNGSKDNHTTREHIAIKDLELLTKLVLELVRYTT